MHLFVLYMKKKSTILVLLFLGLLVIFTTTTSPDITNPLVIGGFFALFACVAMSMSYTLLRTIHERGRRLMWSAALTAYASYLLALSSLRLLTAPYLLVSSAVLTILLFIIEKSYTR